MMCSTIYSMGYSTRKCELLYELHYALQRELQFELTCGLQYELRYDVKPNLQCEIQYKT